MVKKSKEVGKQMSMFDDEKIIKTTINDAKAERLMNEIESGLIVDPVASTEDMLKLVYMDVFNKQWNKRNYIIRSLEKHRSSDKGLHEVRAAANLELDKSMLDCTVADLKICIDKYIEDAMHHNEYVILHEMWREFKFVVLFDPQQTFMKYNRIVRDADEIMFIKLLNSYEPDELKKGVSINARSYEWLTFGLDKILTYRFDTETHNVFEAHAIGKISFSFDSEFIVKVCNDLNTALMNERYTYLRAPELFTDICDEKRI